MNEPIDLTKKIISLYKQMTDHLDICANLHNNIKNLPCYRQLIEDKTLAHEISQIKNEVQRLIIFYYECLEDKEND